MKKIIYCVDIVIMMFFIMMTGCVSSEKKPGIGGSGFQSSGVEDIPQTLAILPFENNSVTDPLRYAPLTKGLSAMLITDLNNSGTPLKIIEREKIKTLLEEVVLSQTGSVDKSTAIKMGKILGAQAIAFGSFMVLDQNIRMDLRIIKVETSETIMAESINGSSSGFIELEQRLAQKIANSLKFAFQPSVVSGTVDIDAALLFSKGIEAMDAGNLTEAKNLFQKCIEQDPSYKAQVKNVKGLGL